MGREPLENKTPGERLQVGYAVAIRSPLSVGSTVRDPQSSPPGLDFLPSAADLSGPLKIETNMGLLGA